MSGVLVGFATIFGVVAIGYLLAAIRVLDADGQAVLSTVSFFVASPCLLFTVTSAADIGQLAGGVLLVTALGLVVASLPYVVAAVWVWRRRPDEVVVGALCAAYGNAGNFGLPVALYILGDAALVVPVMLVQLVVVQPLALALLDGFSAGPARFSVLKLVRSPLTNPITVGTMLGMAVSVTGFRTPLAIASPVGLVGDMAIPAVLVAYGIALRLGPGLGRGVPRTELGLVVASKLVLQPLAAYGLGRLVGLSEPALLAVVVCASLPTAQNIFVVASRFGRGAVLARDAIFLSTVGAVPVIVLATAILR